MTHGPGETLLTGTTAERSRRLRSPPYPAAPSSASRPIPEGSPYEAHVTKSDGTQVTVKVDANFKVTATEEGFGAGPGGGRRRLLLPSA